MKNCVIQANCSLITAVLHCQGYSWPVPFFKMCFFCVAILEETGCTTLTQLQQEGWGCRHTDHTNQFVPGQGKRPFTPLPSRRPRGTELQEAERHNVLSHSQFKLPLFSKNLLKTGKSKKMCLGTGELVKTILRMFPFCVSLGFCIVDASLAATKTAIIASKHQFKPPSWHPKILN